MLLAVGTSIRQISELALNNADRKRGRLCVAPKPGPCFGGLTMRVIRYSGSFVA